MVCHVCLYSSAQTQYKGSLYCIKCLWEAYPKLKEIQVEKSKPKPKQDTTKEKSNG